MNFCLSVWSCLLTWPATIHFYSPSWFPHVSLLQVSSCSPCSSRSSDSTCKSTLLWQERKYHTPPATWTLRIVRMMNRKLIRSIVLVPSSFSLEAAEKHSTHNRRCLFKWKIPSTVNHALLLWFCIYLSQ